MKLEIDGIVYDVIVERKHIKNTYLRVKEDLNIYVTTNSLTPNFAIKKFVNDNVKFIEKQIDKMSKRIDKKTKNYFLGKEIDIVILNTCKKANFDGETLFVKNKSEVDKWYKKM